MSTQSPKHSNKSANKQASKCTKDNTYSNKRDANAQTTKHTIRITHSQAGAHNPDIEAKEWSECTWFWIHVEMHFECTLKCTLNSLWNAPWIHFELHLEYNLKCTLK
jgi:hypothetical protein